MKLLKHYCKHLRILTVLIALMFGSAAFSQERQSFVNQESDSMNLILKRLSSAHLPGKVNIIPHDDRILDLLWRHVNFNDSVGIYGWKVLIYNGRSRASANEAEALFLNSFPELVVGTKVVYPEPPDFKTLIGVFRTKEEAFKLQQYIKGVFKNCYLVYVRLDKGELDD
ncbi:MAG: hypothetical protein KAH17_03665 [Bacteroidales bacterium]|nr:hypothetical protein [Bacteroidales bacterium]